MISIHILNEILYPDVAGYHRRVWLVSDDPARTRFSDLPTTLRWPPIQRAVEVIEIMSHDEREKERYESRLKAELDAIWRREGARDDGIELGLAQGKQLGLLSGIALGLNVKFGPAGDALLPRVRAIADEARLLNLQRTILLANSIQEVEAQLG